VRSECADTIVYECVSVAAPTGVTDPDDLCTGFDGTDLDLVATFSDYSTGTLVPGTYSFSIRGTADSGDTQIASFDWVLTSPCEAPGVAITDPGQTDYMDDYTDVEQTFMLTTFTTVPVGCAPELTYECTGVEAPDGSDVTSTLCALNLG